MPRIDNKPLVTNPKKRAQKYLILLSDQSVIIDTEFAAMKKARKLNKPILDMLPTSARILPQHTNLSVLLERLENYQSETK